MKQVLIILFTIISLAISTANANTIEHSNISQITSVKSYMNWGTGDVVFNIEDRTSTCVGYWFNKNEPGYYANLSLLVSAYHAQSPLYISADTSTAAKWDGSLSDHYCKLYKIAYTQP